MLSADLLLDVFKLLLTVVLFFNDCSRNSELVFLNFYSSFSLFLLKLYFYMTKTLHSGHQWTYSPSTCSTKAKISVYFPTIWQSFWPTSQEKIGYAEPAPAAIEFASLPVCGYYRAHAMQQKPIFQGCRLLQLSLILLRLLLSPSSHPILFDQYLRIIKRYE